MKVTNWRRKLAASLVAGGLMAPVATAADLDTNLVTNAGFESVDFGTTGGYGGPMILGWTDGTNTSPFAYSHDETMDIPDYANGGIYTGGSPPAGTGSWYFTSNSGTDSTGPGQVTQDIDVSGGASGALIASGEGAANLSAYFSSFGGQGDFGTLHVEFQDGASNSLGSVQVSDSDTTDWTRDSIAGLIPVGTATARVSVFGTALAGGPDGYIDNVDVQVTAAENFLMFLEVDTTTGVGTLRNNTGESIAIDYYEVTSAGNSLDPADGTGWNSLQDQDLAGFPAGNGSGNGWEQAGGSDDGVISESYLTGNSSLADQSAVSLGALYDPGDPQDLAFSYGVVSEVVLTADFDNDGDVDGNDYHIVARGLGGAFDDDDLNAVINEFGDKAGPSGTSNLVTGFVRYVTPSALSTAVPEPSCVVLVGMGLAAVLAGRRRG